VARQIDGNMPDRKNYLHDLARFVPLCVNIAFVSEAKVSRLNSE
jgi:hypothetical protein